MVTDSGKVSWSFFLLIIPLIVRFVIRLVNVDCRNLPLITVAVTADMLSARMLSLKGPDLGPRVTLDDERCILCSRCIRFCQEVVDDDVLGFVDRGSFSTLTCFPGKELSNNYSLNTVDLCPVGALTSTDFRFKMRVWFLKESPSICTESSAGSNILVSSREGVIHRITPRRNDSVNDSWMADSGRELYKSVTDEKRLLSASC